MEKKNLVTTCEFDDYIVPYLYNELAIAERDRFELHLADCIECTDEFAASSNARYSVFEWHKEEFVPLPTPKFVIPELAKAAASGNRESGWLAGVVAALSFVRSPLAVAVVLLVFLGVGFVAFTLLGTADNQIAANLVEEPKTPKSEIVPTRIDPDAVSITNASDNLVSGTEQTTLPRRKATAESRSVPANVKIKPAIRRNIMPQMAKKPVLNDFKEETDESLRLSDLFDEVGG